MDFKCPNPRCKQALTGPDDLAGQRVKCPTCSQLFVLPPALPINRSFVIYDLETTGLRPDSDDFIQIAAVRFHNGRLVARDEFFSFAKPRSPISSFITNYTGVTNDHVRHAPSPAEVLHQFSKFVGNSTLIAHNGKRFDSKFLAATCNRHRLLSREVECIDSIRISKLLFGSQRGVGHSLDHVITRLNLDVSTIRRHDARGDVEVLGRALETMWSKLRLDPACAGVDRHSTLLPRI